MSNEQQYCDCRQGRDACNCKPAGEKLGADGLDREREEFEAAFADMFFSSCFEREADGSYAGRGLQGAWLGWQKKSADAQRLLSQLREDLAQRDAEVVRLRRFEAAYIEWQEKTEWVQADAKPKELGKHRADVLRERIDALSVKHSKSGFCGDPYVHDCGRNDCPLSDSYAGHANKVAGEKGNAN